MEHIMKHEKTAQLFLVLGSIYGYLWQKQLEDNRMSQMTLKIWACEVESMDVCEIEFGLKKCIKKLEFPPTLPQFIQKCQIEAQDIGIEADWRISLSSKNKHYEEVNKSISQHDRNKPWWDYEKIFKARYDKHVENRLNAANESHALKLGIIRNLIGNNNFLLETT